MRPDEWAPEPAGGNGVDPKSGQQGKGSFVKRVPGGDPDVGLYSFTRKDFGAKTELLLLLQRWEGSEFALLPESDQAAVGSDIKVLITVHGNGPAEFLPSADSLPKIGDWCVGLENRILVIGNDCQDRLDVVMEQS